MNKCAFGRVSLQGLFEAEWPFGTDLYIRILYLCAGETQAALCAVDSSDTFVRETAVFRARVSECTGIPADSIWYHELQLHAAPGSHHLKGESMLRIADAVAREIGRIRPLAEEFDCSVGLCDMGMDYSMNREQYVEGLGGVTVWSGILFDEQGKAYIQDPSRMLLKGYTPDLPVFDRPIYFDNPVDSRGYLFVFTGKDGKILGTVSHFAAHPDVAVLFELRGDHNKEYRYNWDWPGYVCAYLEEAFSAPSMYINGPCADLAAKKGFDGMDDYASSDGECRRIGREIGEALLHGWKESRTPLGEKALQTACITVEIPMRADYPASIEEAHAAEKGNVEAARLAREKAIEDGAAPWKVKRLTDDLWKAERNCRFIDSVLGLDNETLKKRTVSCTVPALKLGDFLFIGVPGESLVEVTYQLRSMFTGVYTIPVDQVNGYYGYMATPTSLTLGGYTYWESWIARDGVPLLLKQIAQGLTKFALQDE